MNFVEFIIGGLGGMAVTKSLLLLLIDPSTIKTNEMKNKIDAVLEENGPVKDSSDVRYMLTWILDDKFEVTTYSNNEVSFLLTELEILKNQMIKFYLSNLSEIEDPSIVKSCDIHTKLSQFSLQLMRLRMVIKPEVQLSVNRHPETNIVYIASKGFWLNDDGSKERKFTKNIGRAEGFPKGIKDTKAMRIGVSKLRSVMLEKYREAYSK